MIQPGNSHEIFLGEVIRTGEVIENGKPLGRSLPQRREMAGRVTIFVDSTAKVL